MDSKGLDRLLPRHQVAPMNATLEWDVQRPRRILWKRDDKTVEGSVVDLSLDGALIEVPLDRVHEIGDAVGVRLGGAEGHAHIRHKRLSESETGWLYGVQWVQSPDLSTAIESGVEQIRANASTVKREWEARRR